MRKYKVLLILVIIMLSSKFSFGQDISNDTLLANQYIDIAVGLFKETNFDSANYFFVKASYILKENALWSKYLEIETKRGTCFQKQQQYDSSIIVIKAALKTSLLKIEKGSNALGYAYYNLGFPYYYLAQYDSVLYYWDKSLKIQQQNSNTNKLEIAKKYGNLGVISKITNDFDLALKYYLEAVQIFTEELGENHKDVAKGYVNIGNVYLTKNEYKKTLNYYVKSLNIYKGLFSEKNEYVADCYNNIGAVYTYMGEEKLAIEYYLKALKIYIDLYGEKHLQIAIVKNNIGVIYFNNKEYEEALKYLVHAAEIRMEKYKSDHPDIARSFNNIGNVYIYLGDYNLALDYFDKAIAIARSIFVDKSTEEANSYSSIGNVYFDLKDYDLALEYYFKSLDMYRDLFGDKHIDVSRAYRNIGNVYLEEDRFDMALKFYHKEAVSCVNDVNDTLNIRKTINASDYINWDELLIALQLKANVILNMGYTLELMKFALNHYETCDTLINQVRQEITTKTDKIALGEKASEVYQGAIDVCQKLIKECHEKDKNYYKELAFYFSEKNKSSVLLEALAGVEAQKYSGIPDSLLAVEHDLNTDIALYKKLLAEQADSTQEIMFRDKLFIANRQYDALIKTFEEDYPSYFELKYNRDPASVSDIQSLLDNKTAMISYFTGDSTINIFTITKHELNINSASKIENFADTIKYYRYGLINTSSSRFNKKYKHLAFELFNELIPDLSDEIQNLILIPDAELSMIPFETLLTEEAEEKDWNELSYLVKKYNISYSYSANLFYKTFPKEPSRDVEATDLNDWLAVAPVFDDSNTAGLTLRTRELLRQFDTSDDSIGTRGRLVDGRYISPLPGTESEVQAIFSEFDEKGKKALVQIKKNANEEFIKSGGLKNYKYLHFATHGFVNTEKPELSGIFLAQDSTLDEDGILYQGEIYNLDLNAYLTVLSACETGLGQIKKGEGLIGLTRALLYAGSKNIIVSLWKVADDSTSDLMIDFYKNLLEENQDSPEFSKALQQAKLKMINEGKFAHPFYWSPFILIGK